MTFALVESWIENYPLTTALLLVMALDLIYGVVRLCDGEAQSQGDPRL